MHLIQRKHFVKCIQRLAISLRKCLGQQQLYHPLYQGYLHRFIVESNIGRFIVEANINKAVLTLVFLGVCLTPSYAQNGDGHNRPTFTYSSPVSSSIRAEERRRAIAESFLTTYIARQDLHQFSTTSLRSLLERLEQEGFPEGILEFSDNLLSFQAGALPLYHPCLLNDSPNSACKSIQQSYSKEPFLDVLQRQSSIQSISIENWLTSLDTSNQQYILPNLTVNEYRKPTIQGVLALQQEPKRVSFYGSMEIDAPYLGSHQRSFSGRYESTPSGVTRTSLIYTQLLFQPWIQQHAFEVDLETRDTLSQTASFQLESLWLADRMIRLGSHIGIAKSEYTQRQIASLTKRWQVTLGVRATYGPWTFQQSPDRTVPSGWSWSLDTITPIGQTVQRGSRATLRTIWGIHREMYYGWVQSNHSYGWNMDDDDIQGWLSWGGEGMFRGLESHQIEVKSAHSLCIDGRIPIESNLVIGALIDIAFIPTSHVRDRQIPKPIQPWMGATGLVVELPSEGSTKMVLSVVFRVDQPVNQGLFRVQLKRNQR